LTEGLQEAWMASTTETFGRTTCRVRRPRHGRGVRRQRRRPSVVRRARSGDLRTAEL